ncbi:MAG TPA: tripartite tricarboxylate transporter substrate binding protein [Burkholderiales bacterium]|nr:tripartite tricarboxylate transporter substrate binding protein [Burkholderiales bacterium]
MLTRAALIACALAAASPAWAGEAYPVRPIRLILPVSPGGGQDTTARAVSQKVMENLGQPIIVDARPGAGGAIAAGIASRAEPDGYTLLNISSTAVTTPLVMDDVPYDVFRDFRAVSQLVSTPYLLIVTPSLPVRSVAELTAYAKANPDKLTYASAGSGSLTHLGVEFLRQQMGVQMVHVPYKGMGPSGPDLMAGRVHLGFWSTVSALPHVKAGRLRALAVTGPKRANNLADLPTVAESGFPGFAVTQWYGVLAPKRVPDAIVARLSQAFASSVTHPEVATHISRDGGEPVGSSPQQFEAHLKSERAKWAKVVKQTGIRNKQ